MMKVCRVCLTMDVKMYHTSKHNLSVVYEQVTGVAINIKDELPKMLCWECNARLSSAYNIKNKALKTHLILVNKMKSKRFISMGDIESIDKTQLKSTLGTKFYGENFSNSHIIKESDNISQHIKTEEEHILVTDITLERIKLECVDETEAQDSHDSFLCTELSGDSSTTMKVCRVCLAMGVKMYHTSKHNLSVVYEQITGVAINIKDELPKMLCWECVARLSSAYNIKKKALKTHLILVNKMKSKRFISMGDIESIDKTQLKSTLGTKVYRDNFSDSHIINESDNISQRIKIEEEQNFITDITVERIKLECVDETEAQDSHEPFEGSDTEHVSDEMLIDNESNASENPEEDNDVIKQSQKGKCGIEKPGPSNKTSELLPHCKEVRVVLEDIMLSPTKPNTQDSSKHLPEAQSTEDNENLLHRPIDKDTSLIEEENSFKTFTPSTNTENSSTSDPVSVETSKLNKTSKSKPTYTCKYCSFETSVKSRLKYHGKSKHPKSSYNCDNCNFVTNIRSNIIRHINNIHIKNIVYNCSYCNYSTTIKYNLNGHINKNHTKVNVFICSFCKYKTYDKSALKTHVNAKHTKLKVFACPHCSYTAFKKSNLNIHVNVKHTKVNVFKCSYCSFKTYKKGTFNTHVNSKHTKSLYFNCSFCSYKAYDKGLLKGHVNAKHTKVNVFTCSYCNLQVYYKSVLARHIKMKHS